eukprot:Pgem_evm2s18916
MVRDIIFTSCHLQEPNFNRRVSSERIITHNIIKHELKYNDNNLNNNNFTINTNYVHTKKISTSTMMSNVVNLTYDNKTNTFKSFDEKEIICQRQKIANIILKSHSQSSSLYNKTQKANYTQPPSPPPPPQQQSGLKNVNQRLLNNELVAQIEQKQQIHDQLKEHKRRKKQQILENQQVIATNRLSM